MAGELDLDRLIAMERHLGQPLAEIVSTLVRELDSALDAIEGALAGDDLVAAALAAHAARNSALMIEARPMLARLDELESYARRGQRDGAADAHRDLRDGWPRLRDELQRAAVAGRS